MTTTSDTLDELDVHNLTTSDSAAATHPAYADITFQGSICQQLINTRHLPLVVKFETSFNHQPRKSTSPPLDYSQTSCFCSAVESELLASTGIILFWITTASSTLVACTDGSCPNNRTVGLITLRVGVLHYTLAILLLRPISRSPLIGSFLTVWSKPLP